MPTACQRLGLNYCEYDTFLESVRAKMAALAAALEDTLPLGD